MRGSEKADGSAADRLTYQSGQSEAQVEPDVRFGSNLWSGRRRLHRPVEVVDDPVGYAVERVR